MHVDALKITREDFFTEEKEREQKSAKTERLEYISNSRR
jgi:hypothetical protein